VKEEILRKEFEEKDQKQIRKLKFKLLCHAESFYFEISK